MHAKQTPATTTTSTIPFDGDAVLTLPAVQTVPVAPGDGKERREPDDEPDATDATDAAADEAGYGYGV